MYWQRESRGLEETDVLSTATFAIRSTLLSALCTLLSNVPSSVYIYRSLSELHGKTRPHRQSLCSSTTSSQCIRVHSRPLPASPTGYTPSSSSTTPHPTFSTHHDPPYYCNPLRGLPTTCMLHPPLSSRPPPPPTLPLNHNTRRSSEANPTH